MPMKVCFFLYLVHAIGDREVRGHRLAMAIYSSPSGCRALILSPEVEGQAVGYGASGQAQGPGTGPLRST
jgi:hypothetical protein